MLLQLFILTFALQAAPQSAPKDDVKDALARAEALYFEARFKDSIQLLTGLDEQLQARPDRLQDRIGTKLQLALANVGLNDMAQAKNYFRQLYSLDADYAVDPQQFSPKVLALANDAKTEQNQARCKAIVDDAHKKMDSGNVGAVITVMGTSLASCPALAELQPAAADALYKSGVDSYKRGDLNDALQKFQMAVKLAPKHELAQQYLDLTQSKQQVTDDRVFIDWQSDFDAHRFAQATAGYRKMLTLTGSGAAERVERVKNEYRKALTSLVELSNRTCPTGDTAKMDSVKSQIADMLPDPSFGDDIRAQLTTCSPRTGCVVTPTSIALKRLKTQVNPEITPNLRSFMGGQQVSIRVKARIDESGNVTSISDVQGGNTALNNAVKNAVEKWKFSPAFDQAGPRCVDTEITVVIAP